MIVVSDTSPLNYLVLIEQVDVLPALFGRVIAPRAVIAELDHPATPSNVRYWATSPPDWLEIAEPAIVDPSLRIGPGETQAIGLARELGADVLLIDERAGAVIAKQAGLFVTGTLGVLEVAAERGLLALPEAVAALRRTSFRVTESLLNDALARNAVHMQREKKEP